MDLLLLAAGAVVLIGITLWIVWPARTAERVGNPVQGEEVSETRMAETATPPPAMPPQGDRFEDQYTSATADLSAGAVAAAVESMQIESPELPAALPQRDAYANLPGPTLTTTTPALPAPSRTARLLAKRRSVGLGAGALLALSGGAGGAWLYARWQHERNRPINRLRRGAREMAGRLGERIPDVNNVPQAAAPMGGAATALLLSALVAGRQLRRGADDPRQDIRERRPLVIRIGFGGLVALIGAGGLVMWRRVRRAEPDRSTGTRASRT